MDDVLNESSVVDLSGLQPFEAWEVAGGLFLSKLATGSMKQGLQPDILTESVEQLVNRILTDPAFNNRWRLVTPKPVDRKVFFVTALCKKVVKGKTSTKTLGNNLTSTEVQTFLERELEKHGP